MCTISIRISKGPIQWHPNNRSITCEHCILHTCIVASMLLDVTSESLYILRARPAIWIPVRLSKAVQGSPCDGPAAEAH